MALAGGGVIGGMVLLGRGFTGYREAARMSGTSPSLGVMAWEEEVLTEVAAARTAYSPAAAIPDQAVTSAATTAAVRSLFAVVERYPEVKSAANVMALQQGSGSRA